MQPSTPALTLPVVLHALALLALVQLPPLRLVGRRGRWRRLLLRARVCCLRRWPCRVGLAFRPPPRGLRAGLLAVVPALCSGVRHRRRALALPPPLLLICPLMLLLLLPVAPLRLLPLSPPPLALLLLPPLLLQPPPLLLLRLPLLLLEPPLLLQVAPMAFLLLALCPPPPTLLFLFLQPPLAPPRLLLFCRCRLPPSLLSGLPGPQCAAAGAAALRY